jgi:hypothetical protein
MQPTAQAVGERTKRTQPRRGERNVAHLRQHRATPDFQHVNAGHSSNPKSVAIDSPISAASFANERYCATHQRYRRSRAHAHSNSAGAIVGRNSPHRENKFITLDSRTDARFRMANRIRSLQRQRIERARRDEVRRHPRRTSQEIFVSGRVPRISRQERNCRGREIRLELALPPRRGSHHH